jgi:beta-N-acetylhexosaminidase
MEGVRETYPDAEVPVRALKAGVDVLLMPPNLPEAHAAVLDAVRSGELTESRIDTSVRRILELKYDRGVVKRPFVDVSRVDGRVGTERNLRDAQRISDRTTTLVKNDDGLLPLSKRSAGSVFVTGWGQTGVAELSGRVAERGVPSAHHWPGNNPTAEAVAQTVELAREHDTVVVATNGAGANPGQARLVEALEADGSRVVTLAVGTPYDIARYPDAATHLAAYSYRSGALESAVRVLLGEVSPRGALPVMVPRADDPAEPLFPYGHGLGYRR